MKDVSRYRRDPSAVMGPLLDRLAEDEEFLKACLKVPGFGTPEDTGQFAEKIKEFGPICCYLGNEKVKSAIQSISPTRRAR